MTLLTSHLLFSRILLWSWFGAAAAWPPARRVCAAKPIDMTWPTYTYITVVHSLTIYIQFLIALPKQRGYLLSKLNIKFTREMLAILLTCVRWKRLTTVTVTVTVTWSVNIWSISYAVGDSLATALFAFNFFHLHSHSVCLKYHLFHDRHIRKFYKQRSSQSIYCMYIFEYKYDYSQVIFVLRFIRQ